MAEAPRPVSLAQSQGVVVGDYNTVSQYYAEARPDLASFVRTAQFRSLVVDRTRTFVGRTFVFQGIERVLAEEGQPSGYVVIRGEPGIGKTALAAALILRTSCVHHFNIGAANIRSARQFLENTCAQLIIRYALDHTTFPAHAGEDGGFLSQLLDEATARARDMGELPVVIVIDAIDEAEEQVLNPGANRLYLPHVLPDGVFVIVTCRDEVDIRLNVDHEHQIWLRDNDPRNVADTRQFVDRFLTLHADVMAGRLAAWATSSHEFAERLTELAEGNFMYLVHVLPDIAGGRLTAANVGSIGALPRGLQGYYLRHWRDMKAADPAYFDHAQRPILCFLAISREPVTLSQLADWTCLQPRDVRRVLDAWRPFLNRDADQDTPSYRIYHPSFADFLADHEDLASYHSRVVDAALDRLPGFPAS